MVSGGRWGWQNFVARDAFWMTREIDISLAAVGHVTLNEKDFALAGAHIFVLRARGDKMGREGMNGSGGSTGRLL